MIEPTSEQLSAELEESAQEILTRREKALFDEIWKEGFLEYVVKSWVLPDLSPGVRSEVQQMSQVTRNIDFDDFRAWRETVKK